MTPEELAEVEERCRKATAGPWRAEHPSDYDGFDEKTQRDAPAFNIHGPFTLDCGDFFACNETDAEFIAHARADVPALVAEVRRLRAMMPHPSWDDDAAGFIARLRDIATNTRLRCPKDKDESCATCHEAGEMLGVLEMLDAEREAVAALRIERDAALAEVARLREALDAAQRIVRRKADRERGFEDCRACEALGYHGSNERCEAHR